jgi:hypothetical protein
MLQEFQILDSEMYTMLKITCNLVTWIKIRLLLQEKANAKHIWVDFNSNRPISSRYFSI